MCADDDIVNNFEKDNTDDHLAMCPRTGLIIKHASCLIAQHSELQIEISLSETESKHTALSQLLREDTLIAETLREIRIVMNIKECSKNSKCTIFRDNNKALKLAIADEM